MRKQIELFLIAVMFFTRIPCPKGIGHSQADLDASSRYFSLIGWVVGGCSAGVFLLANLIFPVSVSVMLALITGILITGAFHEDGLADVCDGFGGGWDQKQILTIMKDSRLGTYGVLGLCLLIMGKFVVLSSIHPNLIPWVLISGHSLSRFMASIVRMTHGYVRANDDSKVKPMAKQMSWTNIWVSAVFGFLPLLMLPAMAALIAVGVVIMTERWVVFYMVRRIGGYTGDCLGAIQQICEWMFYLVLLGMTH